MTLIRNIKGFYSHGDTDSMRKEKVDRMGIKINQASVLNAELN